MTPDDGQGTSGDLDGPGTGAPSVTDQVRALLADRAARAQHPADPRFARFPLPRPVALVGPMGSGKSTVGRVVGGLLGVAALDTDHLFEAVFGPIPDYFSAQGEPAFRSAEAEIVQAVLSTPRPVVLSLGGGAVISATTRQALKSGPAVVHLDVDEAEALARLGGGEGRPVLAGDPARTWRRIRAEREHLYREVATWTVTTTGWDAGQVAGRIADLLAEAPSGTVPADLVRQHPNEQHSGDARR